jgi:hypothetical protein
MSQCQLETFENRLPDPTRGSLFCPPNCAGTMPTPGQGAMPSPPKYVPALKDAAKEGK